VFSLSRKLKLNLNSHFIVIFVLRLVKPLSKNTKRNRPTKVKVTHCSNSLRSRVFSKSFSFIIVLCILLFLSVLVLKLDREQKWFCITREVFCCRCRKPCSSTWSSRCGMLHVCGH